jgi:DNA primase
MNLLDELKAVSIVQVAHDLQLVIDARHKVICPFHEEDTPSLVLYPHTNSFYCFGCGKTGNQITLYQEIRKIDFKQTMQEMANLYVPSFYNQKSSVKPYTKPQLQAVRVKIPEKEVAFNAIHSQIYEAFRDFCLLQPTNILANEAHQYLQHRGLSQKTIQQFRLFVIKDYVEVNAYLRSRFSSIDLQESGLFNEKNNLVFYRHPLIIPYVRGGRIVYLQGRILGQAPDKFHKYCFLTGKPITLFNADILKDLKLNATVYVTEGAFDCMKLVQEGIPAVSLSTANVFKRDWADLFKRFEVCFYLDNDQAGHKAADEMEALFRQYGISTHRKAIPKAFKDANEYFTTRLGINEQLGLF